MRLNFRYVLLFSGILLFSSCVRLEDPEKYRQEHIQEFNQVLQEKYAEQLKKPLTLEECTAIALAENYDVRKADLDKELAKYDKQKGFAAFLPVVNANVGLTNWSYRPRMMGSYTNDKTERTASLDGMLPLVHPSAWFMYENLKLGVSVASITSHYVRQAVLLKVTSNFFLCLISEDTLATLETQIGAAKSQFERIDNLCREGFAAPWQREQAEYQYKTRMIQYEETKRDLANQKAVLLESMGLNPLGTIQLDRSSLNFEQRSETLEEMVLTALEEHPSLSLADHQIVMSENTVRKAICDFLPTLNVSGASDWTSNSIADYSKNAYVSFNATWNLFKGFTDMANYKSAKVLREQAMLDREATFLSVIVEVVKSYHRLEDAKAQLRLAELGYSSYRSKYVEYESKQKEGLVSVNDMLDAQADMDAAQAYLASARYHRYIADALLRLSMGIILPKEKENQ